jgi:hypothetical protein
VPGHARDDGPRGVTARADVAVTSPRRRVVDEGIADDGERPVVRPRPPEPPPETPVRVRVPVLARDDSSVGPGIEVRIGRIEVRVAPPAPPPAPLAPRGRGFAGYERIRNYLDPLSDRP